METQNKISVKNLTEEITLLLKDEIVATYEREENGIKMRFPSGEVFQITVSEP